MAPALRITSVDCDREQYRDLLLLADEQWNMVELYLHRGEMFAAYAEDEPRTKADSALVPDRALGCIIVAGEGVDERGLRIAEVKSLAVDPVHQRSGIGRALLEFAAQHAACEYDVLRVGTGDSPLTVPFYEACGFARSHVLPNFFIATYDPPRGEAGVQLTDRVMRERRLSLRKLRSASWVVAGAASRSAGLERPARPVVRTGGYSLTVRNMQRRA